MGVGGGLLFLSLLSPRRLSWRFLAVVALGRRVVRSFFMMGGVGGCGVCGGAGYMCVYSICGGLGVFVLAGNAVVFVAFVL